MPIDSATAKSSFDGFYLFEKIKPGKYRLQIAPAQIARLGLAQTATIEIEIVGGEGSIQSNDFVLRR